VASRPSIAFDLQSSWRTYSLGVAAIGRELVRLGFAFQNSEKSTHQDHDAGLACSSRDKRSRSPTCLRAESARDNIAQGKSLATRRCSRNCVRCANNWPTNAACRLHHLLGCLAAADGAFLSADDPDFSRISGVATKKLREFGAVFLRESVAPATNPARSSPADSFGEPASTIKMARRSSFV